MTVARGGHVEVEGARELKTSLREFGVDAQDMKAVHGNVSSYVGSSAAGGAPRRSGMLAASWRPGATKTNAVVRFGGGAVPYANAIHWGTGARPGRRGPHNIRPNRFLWDAADRTQPTWVPWYLDALGKLLQKVRGA